MPRSIINVLLVFSNPRGTDPLRLLTEERVIQESIALSKKRKDIKLTTCPAATIHDVSRALLNGTFQVIHISGHGSGSGLILETEQGGQYLVHPPTLAELFEEYSPSIQCVILNACYSISQGSLTSLGIPYTIAMEDSLYDTAAIEFSRGFYDALGAGKSIDFAYREGRRRIKFASPHTPASMLPRLIPQGEIIVPVSKQEQLNGRSVIFPEPKFFKEGRVLLGLAIDLSGSMIESIRNETGGHISRLESVRQSFKELIQEAHKSIRESRAKHIQTSLDVFVYGFGLRSISVCDLLSLIKASRQIITQDLADELTQEFKRKNQSKYKGFEGAGDFVRQLGLEGIARYAEDIAKRYTKAAARKYIWHKVKRSVEEQLEKIGDTTLSIEEAAQLWEDSEDVLNNAEELLFGDTPVNEALAVVAERFERELSQRNKDTRPILLIVSDGKYSNVDAVPFIKKLHTLGVTIVSCVVTEKDIISQHTLLNTPDPGWEQGTNFLFEMASTLEENFEVKKFLLQKGWIVYPDAKLFVQANHSDNLKELAGITLSLLEEPEEMQSLPRGW
ncbi:MAG TPA: CHAT domain-containing protein [Methylomirabilota bacterium]|nr:CHAT domain-containing protein [Methylomirabilota bacterium]